MWLWRATRTDPRNCWSATRPSIMALAVCAAVVERGDTVAGWLVTVDCKEPEHPLATSAKAVPLARYVRKFRLDNHVSIIMLLSSTSLWYQLIVLSNKILLTNDV